MSSPIETPDAVISGSVRGYGRPLGLEGAGRIRSLIRRVLKRKPASQHFLVRITYRDYTTRTETVHLGAGMVRKFVDRLLAAETVRKVECAEMLISGRKSFGADYDPANFLNAVDLLKALKPDAEAA